MRKDNGILKRELLDNIQRQSQFNETETKLSDLYMQNVDFGALTFQAKWIAEENVSSKVPVNETKNFSFQK